jgi:hypothetical protein
MSIEYMNDHTHALHSSRDYTGTCTMRPAYSDGEYEPLLCRSRHESTLHSHEKHTILQNRFFIIYFNCSLSS